MERLANREHLDGVDVRAEDADVAVVQSLRGLTAFEKLVAIHSLTGVDQDVADAELLDETQRLLARAGADGEHPDDRADAEDDAQRCQYGARLLRTQI